MSMEDSVIADTPDVNEDIVLSSETEVTADLSADTASDSGETHEQKQPQEDVQQIKAHAAFEARKAKRLEKELNELKNQKPQALRPDVPAMPDELDDDFASKLQARDDALVRAGEFDGAQRESEAERQQIAQQQQQEAQVAQGVREQTYTSNALKAGINQADLTTAIGRVGQYGLRDDIAGALIDDVDGGLITLYLSSNPQDIDALNSTNVLTAAQVYAGVKERAQALKPKQSDAPPPAELLNGGGQPQQERGPKGATFE